MFARLPVLVAAAFAAIAPCRSLCAQSYTVVYSFRGSGHGDGQSPDATLAADKAGNLYGTTYQGGGFGNCTLGCGTAFELAPDGSETVLHAFCSQENCADGAVPKAGLTLDKEGNLFGTTLGLTGAPGKQCSKGCSNGTFYAIRQGGEERLHSFGGKAGVNPTALLLVHGDRFYGTTSTSGARKGGTIFAITASGKETVLHSFGGGSDGAPPDGAQPGGRLAADAGGNIYGTTFYGGASGGGTAFELAPDGRETVLYDFCSQANCSDGAHPYGGLISDASGNLYGTTEYGGTSCFEPAGCGTVFELVPGGSSWSENVLYRFCAQANCSDGYNPSAELIMDRSGNLYGTTEFGGLSAGYGTVFELAPGGSETVLHAFAGGTDGEFPVGGLIREKGYIYGTATSGGAYGCGIVFQLGVQGE